MDNQNKSQKECNHKQINKKLGYIAWHDEAERRTKRGMKQKECPKCKLLLWKDEI